MGAPPPRPDDSALRRFFRFTGSLKFAVVLLFFFAATSLVGMYVESKTDAVTARKWVYNAPWFNLAFGALWLNIFAAAMVRYPWPKRLTGFVITHAGLLIIIIASLISRIWGVEGQMILGEGESSQVLLQTERKALHVKLPDGTSHQIDDTYLKRINTGAPHRIGDSGWGFEVTEYLMESRINAWYERAPSGPPAAHVVLNGPNFGDRPAWLLPADRDPRARGLQMPNLTLDSVALPDANALTRFREPFFRGWFEVDERGGQTAEDGSLRLRLDDGSERMITVAQLLQGPVEIDGDDDADGGVVVTLSRIVHNAMVGTGPDGKSALVEATGERGANGAGPAIEFSVTWKGGDQDHASFARMPTFRSRKGGHGVGRTTPFEGQAIALGFTREGTIWARLHDKNGDPMGAADELTVGTPLQTPWAGITVTVKAYFEASRRRTELVDVSGDPRAAAEAWPGVRLDLYGPGGIESVALQMHTPQSVHHPAGHVRLDWSHGRFPIDFRVRLLDFRKVDYPGTSRAASFESDVRVEDPLRNRNEQVTISMNYPMEHGGVMWWPGSDWAFFQSSYQQPPGAPEVSIFSVAYDPGYAINMFGSILVVFGIFTMFYLVPYFRPKRKRRPAPEPAADAEATQ